MIGTEILHYSITEKLGEGGMGEVYRARDTRLDRDVALKFLPERFRTDSEARERLIREAQAASKLHHTHIVSIFAIETVEDRDFIVMEYVSGRPLSELIREGIEIEGAYELARQIGSALSAAHDAGIVHRDMKPDNILVTDNGEAKILDFGLAKLKGTTQLTEVGSTLGTMAYMSPEQTRGIEVDRRSDIFSLGVILYEMIAGQRPFRGDHSAALTYAIVNETPEPLARFKSGVTNDLQRIMDKALRKDPSGRYQSVPDMLADLGLASSSKQPAYGGGRPRVHVKRVAGAALIGLVAVAAFFVTQRDRGDSTAPPASDRLMVVVLPFDNLGAPDDEYFADGMTEEITTHLAMISGLGVISRTSAMAYKKTDKSLREIAAELGVDYVLEGTIRWDKSGSEQRLRINPQLIRVSDDTHLWADTYDRVFKEVFALQSEIAEEVASALNVTLLEPEREAMEVEPTEDLEAYQYYLRGRDYYTGGTTEDERELAVQMFERAVEIDDEFSLAHGWLARIRANDYFNRRNLDTEPLERARVSAEKAVQYGLGPEGHLAMGYYHYYGSRNYDSALEEFGQAIESEPNNSELLEAMGYVQRRQGRWDEAEASLRRASELDPRSRNIATGYLRVLTSTRQFDEAEKAADRYLALAPDYWPYYATKAVVAIFGRGDTDEARQYIASVARYASPEAMPGMMEQFDFLCGDIESALRHRPHPPAHAGMEGDSSGYYATRAAYYLMLEDEAASRSYADSARTLYLAQVAADPDDPAAHDGLGLALAFLGDRDGALRHVNRAIELMPVSKDAVSGPNYIGTLGQVYMIFNEQDLAIDQLEYMLSIPNYITIPFLRTSPAYDALRGHPRFQKLVNQGA